MRQKLLEANIWKYYILRVMAKRLVFPILTIFLVRNQLTPAQIGIIFSVGTILGLIFEVPSGVIADRIGRRAALTITFLGQALSMLVMALSHEFWGFLIGNAIYWWAGTLLTGTHQAFIYETLHELGREKEIKKISGRALSISQIVTGFLFIGVPLLAKYSLALPFYLNAFVFLLTALLCATFVEPARFKSVDKTESYRDLLGFRRFFSNKLLVTFTFALGFLDAIGGILEDFRQLYLDFIHLDIAYFGLVYLGLRFLTGYFGTKTDWLEKKIGKQNTLLLLPAIYIVTFLGLFWFDTLLGLLFIALDGIESGLSVPIEQEYLQANIDHVQRATLLSINNLIGNALRAVMVFIGGLTINRFGIQAGFLLAAVLVCITVLPLIILFIRQAHRHHFFVTLEKNA